MLLFGGGLSLAGVIRSSGLAEWIAQSLGALGALPVIAIVGVVVLVLAFGSSSRLAHTYGVAVFGAMAGMTLGTIWQKRTGGGADLRTNACVQFLGAAAVTLPVAALTETGQFDGSWQAWVGLLWAVYGLSLGAISLLLVLIRRGAVAGVASLFYLVPPVVALLAFFLFGEHLGPVQIAGMVLAASGVAVASRG